MTTLEQWLEANGSRLAVALDARREVICDSVSTRLSAAYPSLCFDPSRVDSRTFQQLTFRKSPLRFHNVLVAALRFRALSIVEREYAWSWRVLPRYGVSSQHLTAQVRWYFEAARAHVASLNSDGPYLRLLEAAIIGYIERISSDPPPQPLRTSPASRPRRSARS